MNTDENVKQFMLACDQLVRTTPDIDKNNDSQVGLYMLLINEEWNELKTAMANNDLVEIADACADLKWVIEGLEHTIGLPQQQVWNEVARSNMSKISESGKVLKRKDGKVQKPETYSPPDIQTIINKAKGD